MQIISDIQSIRDRLSPIKKVGKSVGLVPTMGALHEGHEALIRACRSENDITVVSIFVNPTQFNNVADYENYPNRLDEDKAYLEHLGVDILFSPSQQIIYPKESLVKISFGSLETTMEGKHRPGHFSGVGLIVAKLFNIIQPHQSYFGQKDFQQTVIIQQLVHDLCISVQLNIIPTVRESSGLALSSRNLRLTDGDKMSAKVLFEAISEGAEQLKKGLTAQEARQYAIDTVKNVKEVNLEYLEIVDQKTLLPIHGTWHGNGVALCIAGYVNEIRLIDNILLKGEHEH